MSERIIETDAYRRLESEQSRLEWFTAEDRAIFYGELKGYAAEKGYLKSEGWCAHKYKLRFGYWPEQNVKATPTLDCGDETRRWIQAATREFWKEKK